MCKAAQPKWNEYTMRCSFFYIPNKQRVAASHKIPFQFENEEGEKKIKKCRAQL